MCVNFMESPPVNTFSDVKHHGFVDENKVALKNCHRVRKSTFNILVIINSANMTTDVDTIVLNTVISPKLKQARFTTMSDII